MKKRARAMGIVGVTIGLSFALAIVIGPPLASAIGVRGIFWLTAILALAGLGLTFARCPDVPRIVHHRDVGAAPRLFAGVVGDRELLRLDFAIFALPLALAISACVIPVSRSNTIWIRRWIFGFFSRLSARCNRLTWSALHLAICASAPNQVVSSESILSAAWTTISLPKQTVNYRFKSL